MAKLILQDGTIISGQMFGCRQQPAGEVVFYTGMAGYETVLSDPAFYGQIVVMTYPLIGNYGITYNDIPQKKSYASAIIVRELCDRPSNWAANTDLDSFLCQSGICGISGVDTRSLTRILRHSPGITGIITDDETKIDINLAIADSLAQNADPVAAVSSKEVFTSGSGTPLALLNLGLKPQLLEALINRGYAVTVYPHDTPPDTILNGGYKAVVVSGGPGDPNNMPGLAQSVRSLLGKTPIMAIGLGHQLLAIANGAKVSRLACGHRGDNQPVKDINSQKVYITKQNHGFSVLPESIGRAIVTHINWNDMSCEGLDYPHLKAFGVQFYPHAGFEGTDTGYIYDRLKSIIGSD